MSFKKNNIEMNNIFDLLQSLSLDAKIEKDLIELCRQNDIASLGLFGSFSKGEQTESSDIDLLATYTKSKSLLKHIKIEMELEKLLGKKVDLLTEKSLSPYIYPTVKKELRIIYFEG